MRKSKKSSNRRSRRTGPVRKSSRGGWTKDEDERLKEAVKKFNYRNWKAIAEELPGRTNTQCLHRWQKVLDPTLIKGSWTKDEDEKIMDLVERYGAENWSMIASHLDGRIGKQCRERYLNHLDPSLRKGPWEDYEIKVLLDKQKELGNKWSVISKFISGRTDNACKNCFNSIMAKKNRQRRKHLRTCSEGGRGKLADFNPNQEEPEKIIKRIQPKRKARSSQKNKSTPFPERKKFSPKNPYNQNIFISNTQFQAKSNTNANNFQFGSNPANYVQQPQFPSNRMNHFQHVGAPGKRIHHSRSKSCFSQPFAKNHGRRKDHNSFDESIFLDEFDNCSEGFNGEEFQGFTQIGFEEFHSIPEFGIPDIQKKHERGDSLNVINEEVGDLYDHIDSDNEEEDIGLTMNMDIQPETIPVRKKSSREIRKMLSGNRRAISFDTRYRNNNNNNIPSYNSFNQHTSFDEFDVDDFLL